MISLTILASPSLSSASSSTRSLVAPLPSGMLVLEERGDGCGGCLGDLPHLRTPQVIPPLSACGQETAPAALLRATMAATSKSLA